MSTLTFKDRSFTLKPYESVLDCLLRHGEALPYACKAGMCQACLIRAVDCKASEESRKWIKPELQARGFTLACQWVPDGDVAAALPAVEDFALKVRLVELTPLNQHVLRARLTLCDPAARFICRPGQYVTITNPGGVTRSYSVANDYTLDGALELHISSTSHGLFTQWLFREAVVGDLLHLRGPAGSCHYRPEDGDALPLLLAGNGTGLAPLYGIACDALRLGHRGPIVLIHGGRSRAQLYLVEELRAMAAQYDNFRYLPCVLDHDAVTGLQSGSIESVLEQHVSALGKNANLAQYRAFVCGSPDLVHALRKRLYLLGLRAANIQCDPFTERVVVATDT
ncbi:MAG: FAD-binding oxidoreductase [Pseudohongiellaceae bacterium]